MTKTEENRKEIALIGLNQALLHTDDVNMEEIVNLEVQLEACLFNYEPRHKKNRRVVV
jgi:hypothetical protein